MYKASVGGVIETAIQGLSVEEQIEVMRGLAKYLVNQGAVGDTVLDCLNGELGPRRR